MTSWKKIGIAVFLVVCMSAIGCLLGQFFSGCAPPANPAADRIAFTAASSPGLSGLFVNYDVYVMNVGSSGLTRITKQAGGDSRPTWSPQGDRIAYTRIDGLYTISADGSGQPELLWRSVSHGTIQDPAWSPDGSKIAFSEGLIYVLDIKTKQVVQLTDRTIPSDEPTWSPDGTRIAFTLSPWLVIPGGEPDSSIAVMNADGSGLVQLTPNDNSGSPEWSPDGSQIVFQRSGNIYVMNADGTNVWALTQDGESYSPTWSPDGTRIAFVSSANRKCGKAFLDGPAFCTSELRIMDADGSNVVVIRSKENENIVDPAWAPRN
jgi:Tol biopolymer transport system component